MHASLNCAVLNFVTASLIKLNESRRTADVITSSNSFDHACAMEPRQMCASKHLIYMVIRSTIFSGMDQYITHSYIDNNILGMAFFFNSSSRIKSLFQGGILLLFVFLPIPFLYHVSSSISSFHHHHTPRSATNLSGSLGQSSLLKTTDDVGK